MASSSSPSSWPFLASDGRSSSFPKRSPLGDGVSLDFRLHRGGDRQANAALWRIVMVRIAHHPETTAYFHRKLRKVRSKQDIVRLLKRYVAREVYRYLPRR